jgi:hypothetical protein
MSTPSGQAGREVRWFDMYLRYEAGIFCFIPFLDSPAALMIVLASCTLP